MVKIIPLRRHENSKSGDLRITNASVTTTSEHVPLSILANVSLATQVREDQFSSSTAGQETAVKAVIVSTGALRNPALPNRSSATRGSNQERLTLDQSARSAHPHCIFRSLIVLRRLSGFVRVLICFHPRISHSRGGTLAHSWIRSLDSLVVPRRQPLSHESQLTSGADPSASSSP